MDKFQIAIITSVTLTASLLIVLVFGLILTDNGTVSLPVNRSDVSSETAIFAGGCFW